MAVVEWITFALDAMFLLAGLAAFRLWWRHRSPATAWLVATFFIFIVLILTTLIDAEVMEAGALGRALIMLLLVSPYLLFRFADAIVPAHRGSGGPPTCWPSSWSRARRCCPSSPATTRGLAPPSRTCGS